MVYTSDKDKRLNSINSCDPICKPSTPLDKSTQRGRPLVVSRAHPNFCTHCGERHASISCPAVDPVDRDAPIPTYSTALPVPPSRCPDCTVLKRTGPTITVLDGVERTVTITERKLCQTHLVGDSTAPPPSPPSPTYVQDSPPLPPTFIAPESVAPPSQVADTDLDLSVHTEQILESLESGDDPLNLLPRDPSPLPTSPTVDSPLNLSAIPPPQPLHESSAGPVRRRKTTRSNMEASIHDKYPLVLQMVKSGTSARQATQQIQMARSTFYKWRFVAEMKLVDSAHYLHLADQFKGTKLCDQCKDCLLDQDSAFIRKAEEMRKSSDLLPLSM